MPAANPHKRSRNVVEETKSKGKTNTGPSPVIAQYFELKAVNPGYILFYQLGDFYELFFDDAIKVSEAIGLTLTKRGTYDGQDVPMAGVPVRHANEYLAKLIKANFRVAVVEQLEDPAEAKKRGSKAVVKRDITRLVTPGTLTEDALLDSSANNYLTALFLVPKNNEADCQTYALASIDISTGEFLISETSERDLIGELMRINPGELIHSEKSASDPALKSNLTGIDTAITSLPHIYFNKSSGEALLKKALGVSELDGFGTFSRGELAAIAALLKYVEITQIDKQPNIRPPKRNLQEKFMVIDGATRASLELTRSTRMERSGSLLAAIDRTVTGPGARTLSARIASPLNDKSQIEARHDAVEFFVNHLNERQTLRDELKGSPDIARALSRITLNRAGPRDLGAIKDGLNRAVRISQHLQDLGEAILPSEVGAFQQSLAFAAGPFTKTLNAALDEELPIQVRDGNFIQSVFNEELRNQRALRDESRSILANLQARYRTETNIKTLKIRHNNQFGYFIEVTRSNADSLLTGPLSEIFNHRQTLANAVRFNTEELIETASKITLAAERALAIESEIFDELTEEIRKHATQISEIAESLSHLDVTLGLAELAEQENYVRPIIEDSQKFSIENGRHPVVEQALRKSSSGPFIENDCQLNKSSRNQPDIWILTGPNMAGKSTYLRQNALIAILAQMGSFVPAKSAHIGLIDRLFSRVGATDDLTRGRSTFMVEMVETAAILNQADDHALVILDEIGRGTATYDGLSIAWATLEHLHDVNGARALFATHYHEMTRLSDRLEGVANATVAVKEWDGEVIFLHEVREGAADRSYGVQVARLAGLPDPVITRARVVLDALEQGEREGGTAKATLIDDLPLFSAAAAPPPPAPVSASSPVEDRLTQVYPDDLSPRDALALVYELKGLLKD